MGRLRDPQLDSTEDFFQALEHAYIFLPVDVCEFREAVKTLFHGSGITPPLELRDTIQFFVNAQLHYIAAQAAPSTWTVQREARYSERSRCVADLRVAVRGEGDPKDSLLNIWFESDNARLTKLKATLSEKVPVILGRPDSRSDIYVSFVYATTPRTWKDMTRVICGLERLIGNSWRSGNWLMSFAMLYLWPPVSERAAGDLCDSNLQLFENLSPRVSERYFFGSTLNGAPGDFFLLNEDVVAAIERKLRMLDDGELTRRADNLRRVQG